MLRCFVVLLAQIHIKLVWIKTYRKATINYFVSLVYLHFTFSMIAFRVILLYDVGGSKVMLSICVEYFQWCSGATISLGTLRLHFMFSSFFFLFVFSVFCSRNHSFLSIRYFFHFSTFFFHCCNHNCFSCFDVINNPTLQFRI